ncbi:hypothetical protein ASG56_04980 [Rhodococcus sp. Leaf7]|uniref:DUF2461 domain-containing protein n=1 Tax=unclassified Rhodococcus (in: high G+C Gram-positive bacteria) TaxID=192944 RepID=UPI0006F5D6D2|nr:MULTISPECIES: DUF2461 domain-containing protein [unclassified Rhodococcus (in: high G+C Gram-positive bacteria)]KQU06930.1 hypothetical protein ASG56_04980 [Rhodococcus sp. Leaf7]KQU42449.1 hypothetical protein ASG64_04980 [Rhodococcus sp. Leaf247]
MTSFTGIPEAALDFYEDLEADNSKTWWAEHKHTYDESVRAPMTALTEVLADEFGSAKLFRPHRDVRFSKDKVPYKTHQGAYVQVAPSTGYYVQVDAAGLMVAGGFYASTSDTIAQFRAVVDDDVRGAELEKIVADLEGRGYDRGGDRLKTSPRGYDADHPRIDLLRHKSLTLGRGFGCPPWLDTEACADHVRAAWRDFTPLMEWCRQVLA